MEGALLSNPSSVAPQLLLSIVRRVSLLLVVSAVTLLGTIHS